ncbi:hypothetical protein AB0M28_27185 [Streptomyces sp. NPDC051940]|uniref:hypothetical protein n=1 Tax=Streptomyces sp. NPDC051940 TaxID=3155675 RepID=UPI0034242E97
MSAEMFGRGVVRGGRPAATFGVQPSGRRHPAVALAMVLPLAAVLAVVFGGWEAVATNASSVAGVMGL